MAWRFQPSKFKNTTPKVPKKEETIFDLPIGSLSCTNNGIQSSDRFLAFCIEGEGGKLGVLPSDARGRRVRKDIDVVCAHAEQVDDFAFLPFEDDKLLTCSRDDKVKVWSLSTDAPAALSGQVDVGGFSLLSCLAAHSTASGILAAGSTSAVYIADLVRGEVVMECEGVTEKALCMDWAEDGRTVAATADKGRQGLVWDPRAGSSPVRELQLHTGMGREARCLYAGQKFVSTGFTNKRVQEVRVWDARSFEKPIHVQEYTATTGVLIPQYDADTKLLFLAGKGTNKVFIAELQDKAPMLSDVYELTVPEQLLGFSLAPKRTVKAMDGEVCRMYQLTKSSCLPIPCIVPRRSYRELHVDLFPDTRGPIAGCSAEAWRTGSNDLPEKISLVHGHGANDSPPPEPTPPAPRQQAPPTPAPVQVAKPQPVTTKRASADEVAAKPEHKEIVYESPPTPAQAPPTAEAHREPAPRARLTKQNSDEKAETGSQKENSQPQPPSVPPPSSATTTVPPVPTPTPEVKLRVLARNDNVLDRTLQQRVRPRSCVVGTVQSKYRHVETLAGIKAGAVFSNLRNVNTRLPTESNGAAVSEKYAAVPLAGPAGIVSILDLSNAVKLPDGVVDGIYNKAQVTDVQWSPFDSSLLACGTDQGLLNLWRIPEEREGEKRSDLEPSTVIRLGGEKIVAVRWHPLADGLLAVALSDCAVELWNTSPSPVRHSRLISHSSPILCMAWSSGGRRLATVGKDLELNVWRPQTSTEALEARLPSAIESPRGARVLFACDDSVLVVVGFTKSSGRQIHLYDARSPSLPLLHHQHIDNAVQPLVPHYDFDSSVLFLSGKGDRTVQMFEVCPEPPFLLQLSPFTAPLGHQAVAFHNKSVCKVMEVEFARAWRLTEKTLELLRFRVPRVKKDVFQSDLFPDALVSWEPATTAERWLQGEETKPIFRSLRPDGVSALALPTAAAAAPKLARRTDHAEQNGSDAAPEQKEVMSAWSAQITVDRTLEQDRMEGVAEEEWAES